MLLGRFEAAEGSRIEEHDGFTEERSVLRTAKGESIGRFEDIGQRGIRTRACQPCRKPCPIYVDEQVMGIRVGA